MDGLFELMEKIFVLFIVVIILLIIFWIVTGIYIYKYKKMVDGKGTITAWFPHFMLYYIGRFTFNKIVGWILLISSFVVSETTILNKKIIIIKDEQIRSTASMIFVGITIILVVYMIVKYYNMKNNNTIGKVTETPALVPNQEIDSMNPFADPNATNTVAPTMGPSANEPVIPGAEVIQPESVTTQLPDPNATIASIIQTNSAPEPETTSEVTDTLTPETAAPTPTPETLVVEPAPGIPEVPASPVVEPVVDIVPTATESLGVEPSVAAPATPNLVETIQPAVSPTEVVLPDNPPSVDSTPPNNM